MKIIQANLQPDFGGAERHALLLARGLRDNGHTVNLLGHPQGKLCAEAHRAGLNTLILKARGQIDAAATVRLAAALLRLRPQVLHLHTPRDYVSGVLAARLAQVPVVLTRHLLLPVKPFMRRIYNRADAIICLCSAVRDNLCSCGIPASKLALVHGAIDTQEFRSPSPDNSMSLSSVRHEWGVAASQLCIGVVGRLVTGKGHECFLEAANLLKETGVKFLIVGDGPQRAALQAQAEQLGLADRVVFTGFRADMPAVMPSLDIVVLPSTCSEMFPLSVMEAMAAGRPVVASHVGGVPEIVEAEVSGLTVPPGDAPALAEALRRLVADSALRTRLSDAAKSRVEEHFSLPRMVAATEQVYAKICHN